MRRTRHKRVPSLRRRALELIAAHPDGCTEAVLAAENISADVLIDVRKRPGDRKDRPHRRARRGSRGDEAADHRGWDAGAGGTHVADDRPTEKAPPKRALKASHTVSAIAGPQRSRAGERRTAPRHGSSSFRPAIPRADVTPCRSHGGRHQWMRKHKQEQQEQGHDHVPRSPPLQILMQRTGQAMRSERRNRRFLVN